MSVDITFEPADLSGIIPEGIYLLDAAKRMGVRMPVECSGREQCSTCVVLIETGVVLLSEPDEVEQQLLGELVIEGPAQRLACRAIIERPGEIVVTIPETGAQKEEPLKEIRKTFSQLPLNQKLAALVQLEATTMSEAMDVVAGKTRSVGERMLDLFTRKTGAVVKLRSRKK